MADTKAVSTASRNETRRQQIRTLISSHLGSFKSTLGTEPDIVNIVLSLCFYESSFNPSAAGPAIPLTKSSLAKDYWNSTPVQAILSNSTAAQKDNLKWGLRGLGLMQCMGLNLVKGASKKGPQYIEKLASTSSAGSLLKAFIINAGDDPRQLIWGEANMGNNILVGMAILEDKWKNCKKTTAGWNPGNGVIYGSRIAAAVSAYLGLGEKDSATGVTPQAYSSSIVFGSAYKTANGTTAPLVRTSASGSANNAANSSQTVGANLAIAGCDAVKSANS